MSSFSTAEGSRPQAFGPTEWLLLALPALIWGTSFLLIDVALDAFSPGLIAFGRIATGALVLGVLPAARKPVARADWPRLWLIAFFWMTLPFLMFPIAQQWIDSSLAGMVNGSTPLFAALVAAVLLSRMPGRAQAVGLLVGFGGVVLVIWPAVEGDTSALGAALVLVAAASYGVALNLNVPVQQRYGSIPVIFRAQLCALVLTAPFGAVGVGQSEWSADAALAVLALGAGATGIAFLAIATLSGRAGATRSSVTVYFVPIVAIIVGVAFRDETVALVSLVGVAVVLLGAWLTSRAERPAEPPEAPPGNGRSIDTRSDDARATYPHRPHGE